MQDLETKLAESLVRILEATADPRINGIYQWPITSTAKRPIMTVEAEMQSVHDATLRGDLWVMTARVSVRGTYADSPDLFGAVEHGLGRSRLLAERLTCPGLHVRLCLYDQPTEREQSPDGWERTFVFTAHCAHDCSTQPTD